MRLLVPVWLILTALVAGCTSITARQRQAPAIAMEVTAYCLTGLTASGIQTRPGIVAADPAVLPLGSRVHIEGLGERFDGPYDVEDTGRTIKGRELDIFMRDCAAARQFGRQTARVRVLRVGGKS
jgi:3D (Asp-Asp-Asp) domain-containing protein